MSYIKSISIIAFLSLIFVSFQNFSPLDSQEGNQLIYTQFKNKNGVLIERWQTNNGDWEIISEPTTNKKLTAFKLCSKDKKYMSKAVYTKALTHVWWSKNILGSSFTLVDQDGKLHVLNAPMNISLNKAEDLPPLKKGPNPIAPQRSSSRLENKGSLPN